jgi:hypothetical protein
MLPLTPELAIKNTMQALPDAKKDGALGGSFWAEYSRNPILSPWGTRKREKELRALYRHDDSTMIRGAFASIAKIIASTPWEIAGPESASADAAKYYRYMAKAANLPAVADSKRPDIVYFQELLRNADFGRGWASFCEKMVIDYLRQDGGAFVEVIAPGAPTSEPKGAIAGLSVLDSVRCWPTGDPEYPVVYWNRKAEYHLIHRSRVMQFQDMPDSDEMIPGYGMSAMSRAIAIAYREILMSRYINAQLDDKPPPGMIGASGINDATMQKALATYRRDQNGSDVSPEWGRLMWIYPTDPSIPLKLEVVQFSTPPEKFDWKVYSELDIDLLALAIGVDRQDLWQLTGSNIGSKGQGETMAQKSRGKLIGLLRSEMQRKLNDLLPDEYEFEFKYKDTQEELERAQIAQTWAGVATSMGSVLSPDEQRNLVANQSPEIKEVVTDEDGNMLSVGDGDVQTAQQIADDAAAANAVTLAQTAPPQQPANDASANGSGGNKPTDNPINGGTSKPVPKRPGMVAKLGRDEHDSGEKAIQATRLDFEDAFAEAVKAVQDKTMNRRRFGVVARALIKKYGRQAYTDGLEDGGISDPELSEDDYGTINTLTVEQSAYVTAFADTLFSGVEYTPEIRAEMWWNKSINPFYQAGTASADKNGLYEWVYDPEKEHCEDCLKMNGQVHRYRDYVKRDVMPQSNRLACKGFFCGCKLKKTTGKSSGRWI